MAGQTTNGPWQGKGKMMATVQIKRNADGTNNLRSLKAAVASLKNVDVYTQGGNWIVSKLVDGAWHAQPQPHYYDERDAYEVAVFGERQDPSEAKYHAGR